MSVRTSVFGMAGWSLAAVGFVAMPSVSRAQDPPAGGAGDTNDQTKIISLDLESTDLYAALTRDVDGAHRQATMDGLRGRLVESMEAIREMGDDVVRTFEREGLALRTLLLVHLGQRLTIEVLPNHEG